MAGLLATDVPLRLAHPLDDVTVADLGAFEPQTERVQVTLASAVGHDRGDHALAAQKSVTLPTRCDQPHDLVAVDPAALLVDELEAIGIAIQGVANIDFGFQDGLSQHPRPP